MTRIDGHGAVRVAIAAGLICLLVHARSLHCDFVNRDDYVYVLHNAFIRRLDGSLLTAAFTAAHAGFWIPLTWLSFALDYQLWGVNPAGYHLTNALLHATNTGLVVLIADRLLKGRLAEKLTAPAGRLLYPGVLLLAGLLFGIHPLRVESVAWVSERKDVLNGLFTLGSLLCYLDYARKRDQGEPASRWYLLALLFFLLSLLAKSISAVLPAVLLVVDWYPLGRLRAGRAGNLLMEKVPFLLLATAASFVTVTTVARSGNMVSYAEFPVTERLFVAGNALFEYVRLTWCPVGIVPFYEIARPVPTAYIVKGAVVAVMTLGICASYRTRWIPAVTLGFFIPLLPVLSFFQNGAQAMAARFTYLPAVAPGIAVAVLVGLAYGKAAAAGRRHLARGGMIVVVVLLVGLAGISIRLIDTWENTGTLWTRQIELHPLGRAYRDRGIYYQETGQPEAALADYSAALGIARNAGWPRLYNLFAFRAAVLSDLGRYQESVEDFSAAIRLSPHPSYYHLRGRSLQALGKNDEASDDLRRAGPDPPALQWF